MILQKIPAGKRGFFHADVFSDDTAHGREKAGERCAPGAGGSAACPAAGQRVPAGAGRRLGRAVRCADAFRAGADAGLCGGLLRCGSRWGRTGSAGPEFRNADRGERLPALRTGCGGSGTVALARPIRPGGGSGLRHTGGKRSLLRGGGGKRRSDHPVLRRRRPAGSGGGIRPAALPARKTGHGQPDLVCRCGRRTGRDELWPLPARGDGLCGGRAGPLLQGPAAGGIGFQRGDGRGFGRVRPGPCACRRRACLWVCRCGSACPGATGGGACGLCGRLRGGGALRPAAGGGVQLSAQRRGGCGALRPAACGLADARPQRGRPARRRAAAPLCRRDPAGSGGRKPLLAGGDGERGVRRFSTPVRGVPLGHRQHPRRPLRQLRTAGSLLEAGARLHAGRNGGPAPHSGRKRPSGSGASARSAGAVHPPGGALRGGGQGVCTLPQPPGGPRPLRGHADGPHGAVQRRGRCTGRSQRTAGASRKPGTLQVWPGVGAVRSAGDAAAGMCCDAGRFGPHPGGGDAAPHPLQ